VIHRHAEPCGQVLVPIPNHMADVRAPVADLCEDADNREFGRDAEGRSCFRVDRCIAPALLAVWAAGFRTLGCCCGHGQDAGGIITLDTGTFSADPRTGTQERFAALHREAEA